MKRTKGQKGITLIALIITVVVLLILVSVAINSIQNDGILSYAGNVANKYNQAQKDEQSVLDSYLNYLKGEQWITIYEGIEETDDDGILFLANEHLFKEGNSYRITVKSDEFSGTVETVAVLAGSVEGLTVYMLFFINEGKAVTANSMADYQKKAEEIGENVPVVAGINMTNDTEKRINNIF